MSYPQGPMQSGYPAPPVYANVPSAPSGGTAITAGVLAILGGLVAAFGAIGAFAATAVVATADDQLSELSSQYGSPSTGLPDWFGGYLIGSGIVNLVVAGLLVVGAIMLFIKKSVGRFLVIAGCALVIVARVVELIATSSLAEDLPGDSLGMGAALSALVLVFPIATLVLAAIPPTARWCAQATAPAAAYPQAGGYGPPQQFGQQQFGQAPQQQFGQQPGQAPQQFGQAPPQQPGQAPQQPRQW